MNKLANTYLDSVFSLLDIHDHHPIPGDWARVVADLACAVRAINTQPSENDPTIFRHDFTPDELAQGEKLTKPLTLADLKRQVDECSNWWGRSLKIGMNDLSKQQIWVIGDFEIRRRK